MGSRLPTLDDGNRAVALSGTTLWNEPATAGPAPVEADAGWDARLYVLSQRCQEDLLCSRL
jgi:hypothetical protein